MSLWGPFPFTHHTDELFLTHVSVSPGNEDLSSGEESSSIHFPLFQEYRETEVERWWFHFCGILIVVPMKYSSLWNQCLRAVGPGVSSGSSCFISRSLEVTVRGSSHFCSFIPRSKVNGSIY